MTSVGLVVAFALLGAFVPVPFVALGPGPTFDTLGADNGRPVVDIRGHESFPTTGHLNMTTVSVTDDLSMFAALAMWASSRYALAPRDLYYPPNQSPQDVEQQNTKAFTESETSAQTAALRYLGYPTKVVAGEIVKHSPADGVLAPGDQLLQVNGKPVPDAASVRAALAGTKPGDQVDVTFKHADQPDRTARIQLAPRPDSPQGFVGIAAEDRPAVPFDINISLAHVGGPSAGLMFALAIVDKLTPGNLDGGKFVAGTGEIDGQGRVSPIGGIQFKMTAAREAGATVFLVPAANCSEAKSQAPAGLELVKVGSLGEAVQDLGALKAGKTPPGC